MSGLECLSTVMMIKMLTKALNLQPCGLSVWFNSTYIV